METGLYYYGFRFLSTGLGRWINRDPIKEKGDFNNYSYVINNTINMFDSLGLRTQTYRTIFGGAYDQTDCSIVVRIRLTGVRVPVTKINEWETATENKWSNKIACCNPAPCCKHDFCIITLDLQFVRSGGHSTVTIHRHPYSTTNLDFSEILGGECAAHEIGHHLGLDDEYRDPRYPNRTPVNTGTVMDKCSGPAVPRHFTDICRNIRKVPCRIRNTIN